MTNGTVLWIGQRLPSEVFRLFTDATDFAVIPLTGIEDLSAKLLQAPKTVIVVELPHPEHSGLDLLRAIRKISPVIPVVFHDTERPLDELDEDLAREDACYCFSGELVPERIIAMIHDALARYSTAQIVKLANKVESETWRNTYIGESTGMQRVAELIRLIAPRKSTVLITGETGTGKEVIARAIHMASSRARGPMVAVNCSALPEALLEAELFGHAKGAFTGAVGQRIGRFEQANHGTIFLDEIGDLPLELQGKLLRVLQEREFERVGSTETIKVDVRVIAATNVDLAAAAKKKKFRQDLYYRLTVIPIHLPPLRTREGDIPLLVQYFIDKLCRREELPLKYVTPKALAHLCSYHWPGNVRELEHTVEMGVVLSGDRRFLDVEDFPLTENSERQPDLDPFQALPEEGLDFEGMIVEIQRYLLRHAMEKTGGNKSRAAGMLGMKRSTLVSKIKALECR